MKCPACGFNNRKSALVCKGCDEALPEPKAVYSRQNRVCSFHDGDKYCPAPASKSYEGQWWCYFHSPLKEFATNRLILQDLLDNGIPVLKDWRDQFMELVMRGVSIEDARKQIRW